jgi:hypothetical protein
MSPFKNGMIICSTSSCISDQLRDIIMICRW